MLACLPLAVGGFPAGHDWAFELTRDWAFGRALAEGQLPPYWASDLYWGCGSPVFLFYPPLFASLAAALSAAAGSVAWGATAALGLLTAVGMIAATRAVLAVPGATRSGARVAAYLLVLSPYLIGDALIRNACAEYAALCLMPVAIEGLLVADRRPWRGATLVAGGVALVVLAHNLMGLVLVVGLVAGAMGLGARPRRAAVAAGMGLGLAISAFYWLPALLLTSQVRPDDLIEGKLSFAHNFHPLTELLAYEPFFAVGLLPVAVWGMSAAAAYRHRDARRVLVMQLLAVGVLLALQLRISGFVWAASPVLGYFQFPWRLMGPLAVVTAIGGGVAFARLSSARSLRVVWAGEVAVLALCVANAMPHLLQYAPLEPDRIAAFEAALDADEPAEHRVTLGDEFLPRGADPLACAQGGGDLLGAGYAFEGLEVVDGSPVRRVPRSRRIGIGISLAGLVGLGLLPLVRRRQSS